MFSCFFCFTFTAKRLLRVTNVAMDKSRLVLVRAIPIATPEAKAAIEVDPVITKVMMSPVSTIKNAVTNASNLLC